MEIKMGQCKMEGAYEIAEILISQESPLIDRWLKEAEDFPHTLSHTLAGWYLYAPKPSAEDIVDCKIELRGSAWVLTMKIRRGKEMLAQFFNLHKQVMTRVADVGITLVCKNCPTIVFLEWDSFGHLGGPLVREAVKSCNAPTTVSEGPIQRSVVVSDSGAEEERGA